MEALLVEAALQAVVRLAGAPSGARLRWVGQSRRPCHEIATLVAPLRMPHEFLNEPLHIGRKKTLRVPRQHPPSADRGFAVDKWDRAHALVREPYSRR